MHLDGLWLILSIKIVATAALVIGALAAAERAGPFWGALFVALPVSVGPTYVILALDHDAHFVADSAIHSLAGNAAIALFLIAYARLGIHHGGTIALAGAVAVWAAGSALVALVTWNSATALLANVVAFGGGIWFTRDLITGVGAKASVPKRWYEMPLRGLGIGLLVALVTTASYAIGPKATGILAMFPVASASLAFIINRRLGPVAAVAVIAGALRTVPSLAGGLLVIGLQVERWGKYPTLTAALIAALAWAAGLVALRTFKMRSGTAARSVAP